MTKRCFVETIVNMRTKLDVERPHPAPLPQERVKGLSFLVNSNDSVSCFRQLEKCFQQSKMASRNKQIVRIGLYIVHPDGIWFGVDS